MHACSLIDILLPIWGGDTLQNKMSQGHLLSKLTGLIHFIIRLIRDPIQAGSLFFFYLSGSLSPWCEGHT